MKYSTRVTGWGEEALGFLTDEDPAFLIIFNRNVPEEIAEICVLHETAVLGADPAPGDTVQLGNRTYKVTAVGDEALHTLRTMGHCTLTFRGDPTPERPGCIMLDGTAPDPSEIQVGMPIAIF